MGLSWKKSEGSSVLAEGRAFEKAVKVKSLVHLRT